MPAVLVPLLPHEDPALFQAHLDALLARHTPADAAERHQVELIAACAWRQRRLLEPETRAIEALDAPPVKDAPALPSLATLARYGARIERDLKLARAELERLRQLRPCLPAELAHARIEKLHWLLARMEENAAAAAAPAISGTPEPEPAPTSVPPAAAHPSPGYPAPNRAARRRLARLRGAA